MKVAIIGSRGFTDYELIKKTLKPLGITLIISGGAAGADTLGEKYANENGIETLIFKPDWKTHGKIAGFLRNTQIVEASELVIGFWDGTSKGTKDSLDKANKLGKKVLIINTNK
jgi:hypothetical protein